MEAGQYEVEALRRPRVLVCLPSGGLAKLRDKQSAESREILVVENAAIKHMKYENASIIYR